LAILVLPAAFLGLLLACRTANGLRDTCLRALVLFGTAATLLTEVLSVRHALSRGTLLASWALAALLGLWFRRPGASWQLQRPGLLDAILLAGVVAIAVPVGLVAVLSPPNSTDAMAYHMPRVVYWAQAGSVAFFPAHYYPQIMMCPLAEYLSLHTYLLSGGDHYANLVQYLGFLGSVLGVSLIAKVLGAGARGQILAAVFCATLPNGILQASGVKNDYLLSLWLVALAYFGLRYVAQARLSDLIASGLSLGLALLTKGTAYAFAPPLLAAVFLPAARRHRRDLAKAVSVFLISLLLLNGPQYWRNIEFSGSPLGYDSAHGDGQFRWSPDKTNLRTTLSNLLRNLSVHLGARNPAWNQAVYDTVVRAHRWMGIDPSDPATTWRWTDYIAPSNSNHESTAPNCWHLLLLVIAAIPLCWLARRRGNTDWLCYYSGVVLAFVLFCVAARFQWYIARLHLPVFVLGSPIAGLLLEKLRPVVLQAVIAVFLLDGAKPFVLENWVRPLKGPNSVLRTARSENYFSDMTAYNNRSSYLGAVALIRQSACTRVGIDNSLFSLEYPLQALLLQADPQTRFVHAGVSNRSARYPARPNIAPCVVVCLECVGHPDKAQLYGRLGKPTEVGRFLIYFPEE
jgi:4-amino-4-deoxy-L-arabinose transferase-like glycosyltransferase